MADAISVTAPLASKILDSRPGALKGWSIRETSGVNAAVIQLIDGRDNNGDLAASISLKPGESTRDWLSEEGIDCVRGLFMVLVSGAIEGAVYYSARDPR